MSDPRSEFVASRVLAAVLAMTALILLAWWSSGCAHCPPPKPAPAPEIVRVEVPVSIPCPAPSEVLEYKPIILLYDPKITDIDSLIMVWSKDTVRLIQSQRELMEKLKVYAAPPAPLQP